MIRGNFSVLKTPAIASPNKKINASDVNMINPPLINKKADNFHDKKVIEVISLTSGSGINLGRTSFPKLIIKEIKAFVNKKLI